MALRTREPRGNVKSAHDPPQYPAGHVDAPRRRRMRGRRPRAAERRPGGEGDRCLRRSPDRNHSRARAGIAGGPCGRPVWESRCRRHRVVVGTRWRRCLPGQRGDRHRRAGGDAAPARRASRELRHQRRSDAAARERGVVHDHRGGRQARVPDSTGRHGVVGGPDRSPTGSPTRGSVGRAVGARGGAGDRPDCHWSRDAPRDDQPSRATPPASSRSPISPSSARRARGR